MRTIILFCVLAVGTTLAYKSYRDFKVLSVKPINTNQMNFIKSLQGKRGIDFWDSIRHINSQINVMISPEKLNEFENDLIKNDIDYKIVIEDVEMILQSERKNQKKRTTKSMNEDNKNISIDLTRFWDFEEIEDYLLYLAEEYPNITSRIVLGQTFEGRNLTAIKISLRDDKQRCKKYLADGDRPIILVDATIHAREWIAPMVAINLLHNLVEHSNEHMNIIDCIDWIIIPVLNPDGYVYTFTEDRFWRKTRSTNEGSECIGKDANRNFAYHWDAFGGASDDPCSDFYRGIEPHTEPEVRLLSELMHEYRDQIKLYVDVHSYGSVILYPYAFEENLVVENFERHEEVGGLARDAIFAVNGTEYIVGNWVEQLYLASGTATDYAVGVENIELAFTIELPRANIPGGVEGFDMEPERIYGICLELLDGFTALAKYIQLNYCTI